jgi:hypothetical protein
MQQQTLFPQPPSQLERWLKKNPPASRRTDPISSKEAETEINRSGARETQQREILQTVIDSPGRTSLELAQISRFDRYQIARRLADLHRKGLVRQGEIRACDVGNRNAVTWWAE